MRPYLAVITDSFREARASRVLWLILIVIIVFLAILAPIGIRDETTTKFTMFDIASRDRFVDLLVDASSRNEDSPVRNIYLALDSKYRKKIDNLNSGGGRPRTWQSVDAVNLLLDADDWYAKELWSSTTRLRELRNLDERESLPEDLRKRRARLRIEAAMPGVFRPSAGNSVRIYYAGFATPDSLVFTKPMFHELLGKFLIPAFVKLVLGVAGVFIAILITSSIIPEMFQTGALQLLLSKPISRSLLFISKFLGGCGFVLINISVFIIGIWLLAGLRLDHWNHRLLLCIPLFVYLFLVYFSVSALAGLIWRNAIVSITITVIFFILCLVIVIADETFDSNVLRPAQISGMTQLKDEIFVKNREGMLSAYLPDGSIRHLIDKQASGRFFLLGPVALRQSNRIVVAPIQRRGFNFLADKNVALQIFSKEENWKPVEGINIPAGTSQLFTNDEDSIIAFGTDGIFLATANQLEASSEKETNNLSGLLSFFLKPSSDFTRVTPNKVVLNSPMYAAIDTGGTKLYVYSRGEVIVVAFNGSKKASVLKRISLDGDASQRAALAQSGNYLVLAREDSGIELYDIETLERLEKLKDISSSTPRFLKGSNAGAPRVSVVFNNGDFGVVDCQSRSWKNIVNTSNRNVNLASWSDDGRLNLVYDKNFIRTIDVETSDVLKAYHPEPNTWRSIHDYLFRPLRTLFPRPVEFINSVHGIVINEDELSDPFATNNLNIDRTQIDKRGPFISCTIFTCVIILVGCIYISRQDF